MKLRLKRKVRNALVITLIVLALSMITLSSIYIYQTSPVSRSNKLVTVEIKQGTSKKEIGSLLKKKGLIHNDIFFLFYLKISGSNTLKASTYELSPNMGLLKIVEILEEGNNYNPDNVTITFKEGQNIKQIASLIESKTNNSYDQVIAKMKDKVWITSLIDSYWFLTEDILNSNIYYPLEGYLFPDTYQFKNKDVTIETIVTTMLDHMEVVLQKQKSKIDKSNFTIHELLTLASIVELEGVGTDDRDMIAEVFYNRLDAGWSLGSDVTACYAFQVDIKDCNDTVNYSKYNPYNTRSKEMAGKLPIGPICNPSLASILGSIAPKQHDYYYFVADKYKKVYFTKTEEEHLKMVKTIKERGDWPW